ncbi:MAG: ThuA domain-containing protein [Bryobacteraceae bacterium]|nr:ThuA domain-containing protein [Bryobacteraceae bacterium]
MKKTILAFAAVATLLAAAPGDRMKDRILVYTHNGKGYVHQNIPASIAAIRELAATKNIEVEASDDPAVFTNANLRRFKAVVFSNSNNEAFDNDSQKEAFQKFVREGGGVVGIHSATGSERNWPWFQSMMGGKFVRHPKLQKFTVRVVNTGHPATKGLPATFEWEDECYYHENVNPDIKPLLVTDPAKLDDPKKAEYPGDRFGNALPLAWYHEYGGGREFYVSLGHKDEYYKTPVLRQLILGGILWAVGAEKVQ